MENTVENQGEIGAKGVPQNMTREVTAHSRLGLCRSVVLVFLQLFQITSRAAVSAERFLVQMTGTHLRPSGEVQHLDVLPGFVLTFTLNQCRPSFGYFTHITSARKE